MPLASGTSVGPYEVVAIGAGRNERLRLCRAEDCESEARHQREFAAGVGPRLGRPVLDTPSAAARRRPRATALSRCEAQTRRATATGVGSPSRAGEGGAPRA